MAALSPAVARMTNAFLRRDQPTGQVFLSQRSAVLRRSILRLSVSIRLRFRIASIHDGNDRAEIQTTAYSYLLLYKDQEIAAYQWDPLDGRSGVVAWPHVHEGKNLSPAIASGTERDAMNAFAAAHLPTGLIPFTAVFRMLGRDFGALPNRNQGESDVTAEREMERGFAVAGAALRASFAWWDGDEGA